MVRCIPHCRKSFTLVLAVAIAVWMLVHVESAPLVRSSYHAADAVSQAETEPRP